MVVILLLNVMELFSVVGVLFLIEHIYGLTKSVCVVPVIPVCIYMLLPFVLFVFCMLEVLLIYEFESWIIGVCLVSY